MGSYSLPSPPAEQRASLLRKNSSSSAKPVESVHCRLKSVTSSAAMMHHHDRRPHSPGMEGPRKRVRKACERCRMKKTKCDGESPCMRCKNDGHICTAAAIMKTKHQELPCGYAEVLETAQHSLIATIQKLYEMVRKGQTWELGEPNINDHGLPLIQSIALKLGCIRPKSDVDLPVHNVIPENKDDLLRLRHQLEDYSKKCRPQQQQQQPLSKQRPQIKQQEEVTDTEPSAYNRTERASSSEPVHSGFETHYTEQAFSKNTITLSSHRLATSSDFQFNPPPPEMYTPPPSTLNNLLWVVAPRIHPNDLTMAFLQPAIRMQNGMLNERLAESEAGINKPQSLSGVDLCAMMGMVMGEQMTYSGYDDESMLQGPPGDEDPYSYIMPE